jgi:hypothetical protein
MGRDRQSARAGAIAPTTSRTSASRVWYVATPTIRAGGRVGVVGLVPSPGDAPRPLPGAPDCDARLAARIGRERASHGRREHVPLGEQSHHRIAVGPSAPRSLLHARSPLLSPSSTSSMASAAFWSRTSVSRRSRATSRRLFEAALVDSLAVIGLAGLEGRHSHAPQRAINTPDVRSGLRREPVLVRGVVTRRSS